MHQGGPAILAICGRSRGVGKPEVKETWGGLPHGQIPTHCNASPQECCCPVHLAGIAASRVYGVHEDSSCDLNSATVQNDLKSVGNLRDAPSASDRGQLLWLGISVLY